MNKLRYVSKSLIHGAIGLCGFPRRLRQHMCGSLILLTYHSFCKTRPRGLFSSLTVQQFEQQLRFLKQHFEVVSLEQGISNIRSGLIGKKPFLSLTIDDGFQDNYTFAWPLLRRHGLPATLFLATDFLDNERAPWPTQLVEILDRTERRELSFPNAAKLETHEQKSRVVRQLMELWRGLPPEERFLYLKELRAHLGVITSTNHPALEWHQVREMHEQGMSFGSHTAYHSILPFVSDDVVEQELKHSKQRLETELKVPCLLFSYPDGQHNERTYRLVKSAGFVATVTQDKGHNTFTTDLLRLKRIEVPPHDPIATFRGRVSLVW